MPNENAEVRTANTEAGRPQRKENGRRPQFKRREPKEFDSVVVSINRVSKTVKGGRRMRFAALVVVGDGNGHVGCGLGKASEIPDAIRKGKEDAMKKMITVALDNNASVIHDVIGKFGSASVLLNGIGTNSMRQWNCGRHVRFI